MPLLGGGVAFFAFLALAPALLAVVSIYGVFADESTVVRHVGDVLGSAPEEVRNLVTAQLRSVVTRSSGTAGVAAVVGIGVALWSAPSGVSTSSACWRERVLLLYGFLVTRSARGKMCSCS